MKLFKIDGAVSMSDIKEIEIDGETVYSFGDISSEYTSMVVIDGIPLVSKNGTDYFPCVAVSVNGQVINPMGIATQCNRCIDGGHAE